IEIEGLIGNEWQSLKSVSPLASVAGGATVEMKEIPAGTTKVRLIFHAPSGGSVSIDHVRIGYGGIVDYQPLADFASIDTEGENFYRFSNLSENADYGYSVVAVNSDFRSLQSGIQGVHTVSAGIETAIATGVSISTKGNSIQISAPEGTSIVISDLNGLTIGAGFGQISAVTPSHGAYILKIGEKAYKVIL
ncbi:MAG: fibronectin type III domain-containing protein, partial [Muribaculaceae bacterium]|nr:fibronectin type III domain-containing protein [Muribaculaceae bacterium]